MAADEALAAVGGADVNTEVIVFGESFGAVGFGAGDSLAACERDFGGGGLVVSFDMLL